MLNALKAYAFFALASVFLVVHPATAAPVTLQITDQSNGEPVSGAIILLPTSERQPPVRKQIIQENRQFHPQVTVIPKGSEIDFPNRDSTQHHVYSFSPAKTFELELFADSPKNPVQFDKPGIVELGCNIHDQMQAFVVITDSETVKRTNDEGHAALSADQLNRARKQGSVSVWHPGLRDTSQPREVILGSEPGSSVTVELALEPEPSEGEFDELQKRYREL